MDAQENEAKRLRQDVEWALRSALDPGDVLPLLHRLARTAPAASEEAVYAHRQLAELLVERHPWRAALHARRVLTWTPEDDRAWAVLGLCQTLLGHYKYAATAYYRALAAAPKNPWYAHNLGHLVDVALGRADDAVVWLRTAYEGAMGNREIAASYAHALARAGKLPEAKRVLARAMKKGVSREQAALWKWLEEGAPADKDALPRGYLSEPRGDERRSPRARTKASAAITAAPSISTGVTGTRRPRARSAAKTASVRTSADRAAPPLESALLRGLENLPLDTRQRARARTLARDPVSRTLADDGHSVESLAAAIAYAIVYIDHVPLTQAEVAASFRVSGASLRGRFSALRTQLHLAPGDTRYRTRR
jgi:hypothetical protein